MTTDNRKLRGERQQLLINSGVRIRRAASATSPLPVLSLVCCRSELDRHDFWISQTRPHDRTTARPQSGESGLDSSTCRCSLFLESSSAYADSRATVDATHAMTRDGPESHSAHSHCSIPSPYSLLLTPYYLLPTIYSCLPTGHGLLVVC